MKGKDPYSYFFRRKTLGARCMIGLSPVVSAFEMSLSCFRLIFLIFLVSEICRGFASKQAHVQEWEVVCDAPALRRMRGGAPARARGRETHHLVLQTPGLVILPLLFLLLPALPRQLRTRDERVSATGGSDGQQRSPHARRVHGTQGTRTSLCARI